nr:hypothetical protein [Arenimonas daejeonensis]
MAPESPHFRHAGIGDGEITVQCGGEGERRIAAVVHAEAQFEAVGTQPQVERGFELERPQRACRHIGVECEPQAGAAIGEGLARARSPGLGPREPVFGQRPAVGELREDHRHAAADRGFAVEACVRAQEQAFAAARIHPGSTPGRRFR